MSETINYESLLERYIKHIKYCTGLDYIRTIARYKDLPVTVEEWKELERLSGVDENFAKDELMS